MLRALSAAQGSLLSSVDRLDHDRAKPVSADLLVSCFPQHGTGKNEISLEVGTVCVVSNRTVIAEISVRAF